MDKKNGMTIGELIEVLKQYPQDCRVVVDGYENGYTLVTEIYPLKITSEPVNDKWWEGAYEKCGNEDGEDVVYIPR